MSYHRRPSRGRRLVSKCLPLVLSAGTWGCGEDGSSSARPSIDNYRFGIKIAYETTRITEPLLPNGTPDYAAAINAATGMGVTPENNALTLLAPVLGMSLPDTLRDRLDIASEPLPPEKQISGGLSKKSVEHYLRSQYEKGTPEELETMYEAFLAEQQMLADGYCSTKECPGIANWVQANEGPLEMIAQAVTRTRYWVPAQEGVNLYMSPIPQLHGFQSACTALHARASLGLNDGEWARATEDILNTYRLAALLGQSTLMQDQTVAATCVSDANEALRRAVTDPELDIAASKTLLGSLNELLDVGNSGLVVQHERFISLAGIFLFRELLEEKGPKAWKRFLPEASEPRPSGFYRLNVSSIDWSEAVQLVNHAWDLALEVAWSPPDEREQAHARFAQALAFRAETAQTFEEPGFTELLENAARHLEARPKLTRAFIDATGFLPGDVSQFLRYVNETRAERKLGTIALALISYRTENGALPASLDALAPDYLEHIPPAAEYGHVLRVSRDASWPELALTLVPEVVGVTGTRSFCVDSEGRNIVLSDGREPSVVEGRCQN